mmetsp:Transcript_59759/g.140764  ORF Transcript_59759/g.140764 Transcript_59759/m.140764 type:complete len:224 (-) Transcript_59759:2-673(-)
MAVHERDVHRGGRRQGQRQVAADGQAEQGREVARDVVAHGRRRQPGQVRRGGARRGLRVAGRGRQADGLDLRVARDGLHHRAHRHLLRHLLPRHRPQPQPPLQLRARRRRPQAQGRPPSSCRAARPRPPHGAPHAALDAGPWRWPGRAARLHQRRLPPPAARRGPSAPLPRAPGLQPRCQRGPARLQTPPWLPRVPVGCTHESCGVCSRVYAGVFEITFHVWS